MQHNPPPIRKSPGGDVRSAIVEWQFTGQCEAMSERILVINPNSSETVTQGIDAAMEPLRRPGGPAIESVTLREGPPGIESQAHVEQVVAPIGEMVRKRDNDCSAFVIACYSDPGLHAAREITSKPVLGI